LGGDGRGGGAGGGRARAWEESRSGQRSWVGCGSKRARLAPFYGVSSYGKMRREGFPEHGIGFCPSARSRALLAACETREGCGAGCPRVVWAPRRGAAVLAACRGAAVLAAYLQHSVTRAAAQRGNTMGSAVHRSNLSKETREPPTRRVYPVWNVGICVVSAFVKTFL